MMKKTFKKKAFAAFLISLLLITSCGNDTASENSDVESQVSEENSSLSDESEISTEDESTPVYEKSPLSEKEKVTGDENIAKPFKEATTYMDGSQTLGDSGITLNYSSEFYGHDSAIDRDMMQYGYRFHHLSLGEEMSREYFLGEFTGDRYSDVANLDKGKLSVYPINVVTNQQFEFNGKLYDTVYGTKDSVYSFGKVISFDTGMENAVLRGTGDFNKDEFVDFLFVNGNEIIIGFSSEDGIKLMGAGTYNRPAEKLYSGDIDGDGLCDMVYVNGYDVTSIINKSDGFEIGTTTRLPFEKEYVSVAIGDINNDRRADFVYLQENGAFINYFTMFGRGDGFFGPRMDVEGEGKGNTNLYAESENIKAKNIKRFAIGDMNGDKVGDVLFCSDNGRVAKLSIGINDFDPPYDYSLFGFVADDGTYKMYAGGRWYDHSDAVFNSIIGDKTGDGDHVLMYSSKDGKTWDRYINGPAFYLGVELGTGGWEQVGEGWWTGNTLEPEVVYVDGVYHMITQSSGLTQSGWYGDYLGYASSTDGVHFTRKIDSPIILPAPGKDFTRFKEVYDYEIGFNHHELIYVADDPDGKPFHLYTGHFINNGFRGYVRIRSADPTCFYWTDREAAPGIAQIGNQIAYISDYDGNGNRLYLRITFWDYEDENGKRTVPTLQYSLDGLNFHMSGINLASVDMTDPGAFEWNRNVYFLGMCTLNGTGEIPKTENGYKLLYLATTANEPAGISIFKAEAGVGTMEFTLGLE